MTANAYLGGWGITAALAAGADIVVCPGSPTRRWSPARPRGGMAGPATTTTALAGALVAGHVIECGPQATGGNYSWLDEITDRRYPGFPVAEVAADGSAVITKHPGTGGLVSPGTVTAQLLYEIAEPAYRNPDVIAHFDTVRLAQDGPDRVAITGTRGSPPPPDLKVAINYLGGYRNTMTLVLTGLDIEEKAAWAEQELFGILGGRGPVRRGGRAAAPLRPAGRAEQRAGHRAPADHGQGPGPAQGRPPVLQRDHGTRAGRLRRASTPPPRPPPESAYGVYWPALIPATEVEHTVVLPDGTRMLIPSPARTGGALARGGHPRRPADIGAGAATGRAARGQTVARAARVGSRRPGPATRAATPTSACGPGTRPRSAGCAST